MNPNPITKIPIMATGVILNQVATHKIGNAIRKYGTNTMSLEGIIFLW